MPRRLSSPERLNTYPGTSLSLIMLRRMARLMRSSWIPNHVTHRVVFTVGGVARKTCPNYWTDEAGVYDQDP